MSQRTVLPLYILVRPIEHSFFPRAFNTAVDSTALFPLGTKFGVFSCSSEFRLRGIHTLFTLMLVKHKMPPKHTDTIYSTCESFGYHCLPGFKRLQRALISPSRSYVDTYLVQPIIFATLLFFSDIFVTLRCAAFLLVA